MPRSHVATLTPPSDIQCMVHYEKILLYKRLLNNLKATISADGRLYSKTTKQSDDFVYPLYSVFKKVLVYPGGWQSSVFLSV